MDVKSNSMTYGTLFTGIGGFDIPLDMLGAKCVWQVEKNKSCQELIKSNWDAKLYSDIIECYTELPAVDIICGGDPCPKHSKARSNGESKSPDLSGYFLAVVGRLRPQWVVRENVLASTVDHFECALAALGYGTSIIRVDAADVTRQSRKRDFVVGHYQASRESVRELFSIFQDGTGLNAESTGTRAVTPCLTTNRTRYDSPDCYIFESGQLRILDGDERTALAGFPEGWTTGFSEATRARMCGNAVVPGAFYPIAEIIINNSK